MGKSEEPNMELLSMKKSVPCELFLLGCMTLQMARGKKWEPERMKAVIGAVRNRGMGSYRASTYCSLSQTTLRSYVKARQESSSETIKQNWVGNKFFLVKQKMIWLSTVF